MVTEKTPLSGGGGAGRAWAGKRGSAGRTAHTTPAWGSKLGLARAWPETRNPAHTNCEHASPAWRAGSDASHGTMGTPARVHGPSCVTSSQFTPTGGAPSRASQPQGGADRAREREREGERKRQQEEGEHAGKRTREPPQRGRGLCTRQGCSLARPARRPRHPARFRPDIDARKGHSAEPSSTF